MRIPLLIGFTTAAVLLARAGGAQSAAQYTVTDLGTLGGASAQATAINNSGQVVGSSANSGGWPHAFVWQSGTMTDLGTLGGNQSQANAINAAGQVVGTAQDAMGNSFPFQWASGVLSNLTSAGLRGSAVGINDGGTVVGMIEKLAGSGYQFPFSYKSGVVTYLSSQGLPGSNSTPCAINASGQVTGSWSSVQSGSSYLLTNGTESAIGTLGGQQSFSCGMNLLGQVVGNSQPTGNLVNVAFFWTPDVPNATTGKMKNLGTLGGDNSQANGINAWGQVVGYAEIIPNNSTRHAFVYKCSLVDLNTLIPANSGWVLERAMAINDRGQIVGVGSNSSGSVRSFLLTPVP